MSHRLSLMLPGLVWSNTDGLVDAGMQELCLCTPSLPPPMKSNKVTYKLVFTVLYPIGEPGSHLLLRSACM